MKKYIFFLLIMFLFISISFSQFQTDFSISSGTIENIDIEEPIPEGFEAYTATLELCNEIVDLLVLHDYESVYNNYFTPEIRKNMSLQQFLTAWKKLTVQYGRITSYKKMQWQFTTGKQNGADYFFSIKILHFEKGIFNLVFIFDKSNILKLKNLNIRPYNYIPIKTE